MDREHEPVSESVARLADARGAELAALLQRLAEPHILALLSDSERLEVIAASARLESWSAALRARAVGALHDSVLSDVCDDPADPDVNERQLADRQVSMEVSLAMGVSFFAADRELDRAEDLREFPRLGRALDRGDIDARQARVIADGLRGLDGAGDERVRAKHRAALADGLFGTPDQLFRELTRPGVTLWSLPPAKLRAIINREAAALDPGYLTAQATAKRADRRLDYEDHSDATSTLHLQTSTEHAAAAFRNVDEAARAARRGGDRRTLDQLRADITVGWLTEGAYGTLVVRPGHPTPAVEPRQRGELVMDDARLSLPRPDVPLVHVTVAATTLLGADEEPATLHGPRGPVPLPADLARELAGRRGARWRRLLYDPATGIATDLSPVYRPRALTHAFVRARDGDQSRFPTSSATRLELDHVREYRHDDPTSGGPTGPSNLVAAGKRDHQLKTDRLVAVTGDANERLTYTTPAGRQYVSYPMAYAVSPPPSAPPLPEPRSEPPSEPRSDPRRDARPDPLSERRPDRASSRSEGAHHDDAADP